MTSSNNPVSHLKQPTQGPERCWAPRSPNSRSEASTKSLLEKGFCKGFEYRALSPFKKTLQNLLIKQFILQMLDQTL